MKQSVFENFEYPDMDSSTFTLFLSTTIHRKCLFLIYYLLINHYDDHLGISLIYINEEKILFLISEYPNSNKNLIKPFFSKLGLSHNSFNKRKPSSY